MGNVPKEVTGVLGDGEREGKLSAEEFLALYPDGVFKPSLDDEPGDEIPIVAVPANAARAWIKLVGTTGANS